METLEKLYLFHPKSVRKNTFLSIESLMETFKLNLEICGVSIEKGEEIHKNHRRNYSFEIISEGENFKNKLSVMMNSENVVLKTSFFTTQNGWVENYSSIIPKEKLWILNYNDNFQKIKRNLKQ